MNDLEQNNQQEVPNEDSPIEYGSARYYDELYVPDGKLPPDVETEARREALRKYFDKLDDETNATIDRYLEHARVPLNELGKDLINQLTLAMNTLMIARQDINGREEGIFLGKQLEAIYIEMHRSRRKAYNRLHNAS